MYQFKLLISQPFSLVLKEFVSANHESIEQCKLLILCFLSSHRINNQSSQCIFFSKKSNLKMCINCPRNLEKDIMVLFSNCKEQWMNSCVCFEYYNPLQKLCSSHSLCWIFFSSGYRYYILLEFIIGTRPISCNQ